MISLLKRSKFFIFFLISINLTTSLIAFDQPTHTTKSSFEKGKDIIEQLYDEDGLLIFDRIMRLFDEIENDLLDDICTEEDWDKINHFIADLARLGRRIYPKISEEELERDIDELLNGNHQEDFELESFLPTFSSQRGIFANVISVLTFLKRSEEKLKRLEKQPKGL